MKRRLKLMNLNQQDELTRQKMEKVCAGAAPTICYADNDCACGCYYADSDGSSTADNARANRLGGDLTSSSDLDWFTADYMMIPE